MNKYDNWKVHCSAIGQIMTINRSKTDVGETVKSFLKTILADDYYGKTVELYTDPIMKGTVMEEGAIELLGRCLDLDLFKNTEQLFDEYLVGTPDLILGDTLIDIKCPKNHRNMPTSYEDIPKAYMYQLQGYMHLTTTNSAWLAYCLMNPTDAEIDRAARMEAYKLGMEEVEAELYEKVCKNMTYNDLGDEKRVRLFRFEYDIDIIESIQSMVGWCRNFLNEEYERTYKNPPSNRDVFFG